MTNQIEPLVLQLQSALERRQIPNEWHQWGSKLLDHLRKPVQVAVLGLPGTGKSTLVNMMLGQSLIPREMDIPVIEIAHGLKERTMFELDDGSCIRRSERLSELEMPPGAIRARMELEEPGLLRQNLVEVRLTGSFGHQMSMVNWVVQWADIILWCTDSFGEVEQKLWAGVPDDIKDHSFLVLTMADRQLLRGVLQERIAALEPVVSEEFLCLYPIATEQAITARTAGETLNEALWKSSGGQQLVEGVLRQVENGRTADMDQAQMLLTRFAPQAAAEGAEPPAAPLPANTASEAAAGPGTDVPRARPAGPKGSDKVVREALEFLQSQADDMFRKLGDKPAPKPEPVLDHCVEIADRLSEMVEQMDGNDLMAQELQTELEEGAEMMLLFQIERDEDAAADAVTLLLQMKKEIAGKLSTGGEQ